MTYRSKRSKATDISAKTKQEVWERDNGRCVVCGCMQNVMPNAHILSRAKGGKGIATNVVALCTQFTQNKCHYHYDFGTKEEREYIHAKIVAYMKNHYTDWSIEAQRYTKEG